MARFRFLIILLAAACGKNSTSPSADASPGHDANLIDANSSFDASALADGNVVDASSRFDAPALADTSLPDAPLLDAFPAVLDMRINCHNDCTLIAMPSSINVPAGTSFEVNWINVGDTQCDVDKIDNANQVPLIIGLDPGTSALDAVHSWCGTEFTGTFEFRVDICTLPSYIPVNCGA